VARAGIQDAAHKAAAWDFLTGEGELPSRTIGEVGAAFGEVTDPALLAPYRDRFFEVLPALWDRRKSFAKKAGVRALLPISVIDRELFEQFDSFLDQHTDADAALVRAVREGRDLALRAAASRALTEAGG